MQLLPLAFVAWLGSCLRQRSLVDCYVLAAVVCLCGLNCCWAQVCANTDQLPAMRFQLRLALRLALVPRSCVRQHTPAACYVPAVVACLCGLQLAVVRRSSVSQCRFACCVLGSHVSQRRSAACCVLAAGACFGAGLALHEPARVAACHGLVAVACLGGLNWRLALVCASKG